MNNNDTYILNDLRSDKMAVKNKAIEELYINNYPLIRSFILKNSGSETEAEDIFQDGMMVLYSKVRNEDFELSCALKNFIFSICRNLWLNRLKEIGRFVPLTVDENLIDIADSELDVLVVDRNHKRIQRLFEHIDDKCKKVLYHFYFHRSSMQAIASEMNFASVQVAKNKKSRCLKKLKNLVFNKKIKI